MKFNDALSRVAWQDFEVLVANYYRDQGYDVMHCGDGHFGLREGSDVDLRMRRQGKLSLVHCRHESVSRVDAGAVARLLTIAAEDEAAEAIVVSSGDIPEAARQVGAAGGATLIDGVAVRAMLGERLMDLHPVRGLPGVDAQHGKAHVVTRGELLPSRGRRGWRGWRLPSPARGGSARTRGALALLAIVLLAAAVYFVPALRHLAHLDHAPTPPPTDTSTTKELPLPTPP
jgi:hypothetical protein